MQQVIPVRIARLSLCNRIEPAPANEFRLMGELCSQRIAWLTVFMQLP
jgi:hypothetical protein